MREKERKVSFEATMEDRQRRSSLPEVGDGLLPSVDPEAYPLQEGADDVELLLLISLASLCPMSRRSAPPARRRRGWGRSLTSKWSRKASTSAWTRKKEALMDSVAHQCQLKSRR